MDHHPSGLIDDQDIGVFVNDAQFMGLRLQRYGLFGWDPDLDDIAPSHGMARFARNAASDGYVTIANKSGQGRARSAGVSLRKIGIEPLAVAFQRHFKAK